MTAVDLRRAVLWAARLSATAASLIFAGLAVSQGPPPLALEGPGIERDVRYVFAVVGIIATLVGWFSPLAGGSLLVLTGTMLGVAAAIRYSPETAFAAALLFVLPGVLFLAHWSWRRSRVVQAVAATAVVVVLAFGGVEADRRHQIAFGPAHPQSQLVKLPVEKVEWVWSGGVTSTSAVVKARLVKDAALARLLVGESEALADASYIEPTAPVSADGQVVSFAVTGLEPATTYFYAVEVDGEVDRTRSGRFETFPVGAASFSIAFAGDARSGSNGAVFDAIRAEDVLLYIIAGDFHYDNITKNDPDAFRDAYQRQLTAPAQAALYQETPVAYVWDDHDFGGSDSNGSSDARDAARLIYREYVPHYDLPAGETECAIYQAFTIGRVRFVMTDTRSEQDAEQTASGSDSILGSRQREWLKRELETASKSHALVVWVNSVPWIAPEGGSRDDWGGYAEERREIADFIAANGITNLVMLAGDAHMLAIDDGSNSDYSTSGGGGFPVFHAAALDRPGSVKGGPYSEGAFPGAGQFGVLSIDDDGQAVTVRMRGLDWEGREIVSFGFSVPAPD